MTESQTTKIEHLQSVLAAYGADKSRWPAEAQELLVFIEQTPRAALLYDEARALDQLLDLSQIPTSPSLDKTKDLQQAILADFADMHQSIEEVVVPIAPRKHREMFVAHNDNNWMTATALAACFAFGIYLGGIGVGDWSLDLATDLAALTGQGDQFAAIADAVLPGFFEEDLL